MGQMYGIKGGVKCAGSTQCAMPKHCTGAPCSKREDCIQDASPNEVAIITLSASVLFRLLGGRGAPLSPRAAIVEHAGEV